jgi:glycine cleavage system H protein
MSSPSDCRFSESHEWYKVDGDIVTVGITQFATNELTDITYVEIQPVGTVVSSGDSIGEVESVKTTSDIISMFDGEIIEINDAPSDDPSLLNRDPFGEGWLAKIRTTNSSNSKSLMDQATYDNRYPI